MTPQQLAWCIVCFFCATTSFSAAFFGQLDIPYSLLIVIVDGYIMGTVVRWMITLT